MNWREVPFLRLCLPIVLGILFYPLCISALSNFYFGFAILFLFFLSSEFIIREYPSVFFKGLLLHILLFFIGIFVCKNHDLKTKDNYYKNYSSHSVQMQIRILDGIKNGTRISFNAQIEKLKNQNGSWSDVQGKIKVHLKGSEGKKHLIVGDRLIVLGNLTPFKIPENQYSFDYRKFMAQQQIYDRMFVEEWQLIESNPEGIFSLINGLRNKFIFVLDESIMDNQAKAVAKALLLGYKNDLDHELRNAYVDSGSMHVLAVSGLHVGIISMFLMTIFSIVKNNHVVVRILKLFIILSGIWAYAILTGLSPSVLRAATMCSFVFAGLLFFRKTNIFNTLPLAAVVLLLFNPDILFTLSFQLSFSALASIIYFQPKIYALIITQNLVMDWIWKLISLSISAQVGTIGISLYHFHQFPLYFWLSGVLVIPMAMLILSLGLFFLLSNHFHLFFEFQLSKLLEWTLKFNNSMVEWIKNLPFNKIDYIHFDQLDLTLYYLSLILFILCIETGKKTYLKILFTVAFFYAIKSIYNDAILFNKSGLVVYKSNNGSIIDFVNNRKIYCWKTDDVDKFTEQFVSKGLRSNLGIRDLNYFEKEKLEIQNQIYLEDGLILSQNYSAFLIQRKNPSLKHKTIVDNAIAHESTFFCQIMKTNFP